MHTSLKQHSVLPQQVILHLPNIYILCETDSLGTTPCKPKREERLFVHLIIILILHCGHKFLNKALNFRFKLDNIVSRYINIIKSSFLGAITLFET